MALIPAAISVGLVTDAIAIRAAPRSEPESVCAITGRFKTVARILHQVGDLAPPPAVRNSPVSGAPALAKIS